MAREDLDLVPDRRRRGVLAGVMTERALARRYIRESREASRLDAPTALGAIVRVLEGEQLVGAPERELSGRVWVLAMSDRLHADRLRRGRRRRGRRPAGRAADRHRGRGRAARAEQRHARRTTRCSRSPASGHRRRDLAARHLRDRADDHARGAVPRADGHGAADRPAGRPGRRGRRARQGRRLPRGRRRRRGAAVRSGIVTRSDLVNPPARQVLLVDHAEQAQSVVGVEHAEIVEILDHHHIGSIETRVPVQATFDPVGSTATLVIERFRQSGMEPSRAAAMLLLGAVLSDTVILNSPTTTERDRAVIAYLEQVLAVDADGLRARDVRADVRPEPRARRRDRRARREGVRGGRRPDARHRPGGDGRQGAEGAPRRAARRARGRASASGATRSSP